ncbi:hypothetical protein ANCCAN_04303 [Ancylostoma caninum]|uniref:Myotubularin phosphatase domain-containing protein n=1 Tax=Ancylostoma caninum TaxID=29170 RepID=A0A368GYS9_ANCCA|nr:hypothetical protein ANCCAN_04303 [Ancylostoma caninum]
MHRRDHQQKTRYELLKLPDLDHVRSSFSSLMDLLFSGEVRADQGFKVLIRIEWVAFGHRFAERNGIYGKDVKTKPPNRALLTDDPRAFTDSLHLQRADENERSPVFLQFLDAVHQLLHRFPTAFQFSDAFLVEFARHVYSGLVGPFIFNSLQESRSMSKKMHCEVVSVWHYIEKNGERVTNALYDPRTVGKLPADAVVNNLRLWNELYNNTLFDEVIGNPPATTDTENRYTDIPAVKASFLSSAAKDQGLRRGKPLSSINDERIMKQVSSSAIKVERQVSDVRRGTELLQL